MYHYHFAVIKGIINIPNLLTSSNVKQTLLIYFRERILWCDKKSHSHSVAYATHLDVKMVSGRNCTFGNDIIPFK
jgi:hypothetical protein